MTFFATLERWTEKDWLQSARPHELLYFLDEKASHRKLRLFACACVRLFWHKLKEQSPERQGVEIAERFVDGMAQRSELQKIHKKLALMCWGPEPRASASQSAQIKVEAIAWVKGRRVRFVAKKVRQAVV